jgi:hypothetical protein
MSINSKKEEYYNQTLMDLKAELAHELVFISGLKKTINNMEHEGCSPLDYIKEALAEREAKRDSVTRAIEKLEAMVKKK